MHPGQLDARRAYGYLSTTRNALVQKQHFNALKVIYNNLEFPNFKRISGVIASTRYLRAREARGEERRGGELTVREMEGEERRRRA